MGQYGIDISGKIAGLYEFLFECRNEAEKYVFWRFLFLKFRFYHDRHEGREIIRRDFHRNVRDLDATVLAKEIDYQALVECDNRIEASLSGSFEKEVHFLDAIGKIRVVIRIAQTEVRRNLRYAFWRIFLVRIEVPVVVVNIALLVLSNASFVDFQFDNASWKSTGCADLVTVLVENEIPLWADISEQVQHRFVVLEHE